MEDGEQNMMKFETIVSLITDFDLNKIEKYI